jgi:hypothetical protein
MTLRLLPMLLGAPLVCGTAQADTRYTATLTGLVCSSCKLKVREAFTRLPASRIEFSAGKREGEVQVSFDSESDKLTRNDAVAALGDSAKEYPLVGFEKSKESTVRP